VGWHYFALVFIVELPPVGEGPLGFVGEAVGCFRGSVSLFLEGGHVLIGFFMDELLYLEGDICKLVDFALDKPFLHKFLPYSLILLTIDRHPIMSSYGISAAIISRLIEVRRCKSRKGGGVDNGVQELVKTFAKFVLLQCVFEGLVEFFLVQLVDLHEEVSDLVLAQNNIDPLLEDGQKFHLGDGVKGEDRVLP